MYHLQNVEVHYGKKVVLSVQKLDLHLGKWYTIIGRNGSGKSTLLKVLAGLLKARGEIFFLDQALSLWNKKELAKLVTWHSSNENISEVLNVFDLVALGRYPHLNRWTRPGGEQTKIIQKAMELTRVDKWSHHPYAELSQGEKQLVSLTRSLAVEAQVYIWDEPMKNLDIVNQISVLKILRNLVSHGKTVITVIHELSWLPHADTLILLDRGGILGEGSWQDRTLQTLINKQFGGNISFSPNACFVTDTRTRPLHRAAPADVTTSCLKNGI